MTTDRIIRCLIGMLLMAGAMFYIIRFPGLIFLVFSVYPPVFCAMIFDIAYEYLWLVS